MSDLAIRVDHLGKQYRLGGQQLRNASFRETLTETARAPLRWLKGERRAKQTSFWALEDVSFEVKHGEAVGIIGRNGAGKSTLLKILSRITSPTRGRVDIYGRVGSLLEVGTGFHPELTGRENIFLNGAILGMTRREIMQKFDEIVAFAEIEKFLDTAVKFYSSGMYVRLAFAVASFLEPDILLVDEVLAVGDAEFQKKCLSRMGDVANEGRTVLFVSHGLEAIAALCSRVMLVENGKIKEDGIANEVIQKYLHPSEIVKNSFSYKEKDLPIQIIAASAEMDPQDDSEDFNFKCSYLVKGFSENVMLCVEVRNSLGQCIFYANDDTLNDDNKRKIGFHQATLSIPTRSFATGEYYVIYGLWEPGHDPVDFPQDKIWLNVHHKQMTRLSRHNIQWPSIIYDPSPSWILTKNK